MVFRIFALTVLLCFLSVSAKEPAKVEGKQEAAPPRMARMFPVGEAPPFLQEIRDGVRYEIDPPPDRIPPTDVVPGFGDQAMDVVSLRLGRISAPFEVASGMGPLVLRRADEVAEASAWLSRPLPEEGAFLCYIWRNPAGKNWRDVLSLIVPDGVAGHPAGSVRITNLFPQAVRIVWGGETIVLPGGKSILKTIKPGAEMPLRILATDSSGAIKRYYSGGVTQSTGERGFITIYRADGEAPRRALKVSMLREPVPASEIHGSRP